MVQRWSRRRLVVVAFLLTASLIVAAPTPAAALCMSPMEVVSAAPEVHRYAWFLNESLAHARLAWQEADEGLSSPKYKVADEP
jgi:hypothetical protein